LIATLDCDTLNPSQKDQTRRQASRAKGVDINFLSQKSIFCCLLFQTAAKGSSIIGK